MLQKPGSMGFGLSNSRAVLKYDKNTLPRTSLHDQPILLLRPLDDLVPSCRGRCRHTATYRYRYRYRHRHRHRYRPIWGSVAWHTGWTGTSVCVCMCVYIHMTYIHMHMGPVCMYICHIYTCICSCTNIGVNWNWQCSCAYTHPSTACGNTCINTLVWCCTVHARISAQMYLCACACLYACMWVWNVYQSECTAKIFA